MLGDDMNLDYLLFSGSRNSIKLDCGLCFKQHTLAEIEESGIGYSRYEYIVWALTREPYEFKIDLEDVGINFKDITSYDIFLMLIRQKDMAEIIEDLNFIFEDNFQIKDGFLVSKSGVLNIDSVNEIKIILRKYMFLKLPKERHPANEKAKDLLRRQARKQSKIKAKYDIYSIMYALVVSPNCSESFDSIINKTVHQIYALFQYITQTRNFDNTIRGIYSGVIKKKDVNFDNINWINKIDN